MNNQKVKKGKVIFKKEKGSKFKKDQRVYIKISNQLKEKKPSHSQNSSEEGNDSGTSCHKGK